MTARVRGNVPPPPAVFLMGPTASGKTGLAVDLAERLGCGIISVDSAMVYRGMDIGTAKPTADVLARAPHRLIDILDPRDAYSAARFRTDALREMRAVSAAGRVPLLVGGTGLYFRALERGLSALPAAEPEVRRRLAGEAEALGWPALHARLAHVDAATAARIHPNDAQRLQRALEVWEVTGRPMSELLGEPTAPRLPFRFIKVVLDPLDRPALHARIADRFHGMLRMGFLEEVERLRARGDLGPDLASMRAVGYRQVWVHLEGRIDYASMVDHGIGATRQLAKRQLTWLRAEPDAARIDATALDAGEQVLRILGPSLT